MIHSSFHQDSLTTMLLFCCLLVMPALITSCSLEPQLDTSLLTDKPCAAPCWHNIMPGTSSQGDVFTQLGSSPFVKKGTLNQGSVMQEHVSLTVFYWHSRGTERNWIYLRDGKVLRIEIHPDYGLTLGEIVDKYGAPENVYAAVGGDELMKYIVILDYPTQGLEFTSLSYVGLKKTEDTITDSDLGVVSRDLKVSLVVYFAPTSFEDALRNVFLYQPEGVEHTLDVAQPWKGFGPVDLADPLYLRSP